MKLHLVNMKNIWAILVAIFLVISLVPAFTSASNTIQNTYHKVNVVNGLNEKSTNLEVLKSNILKTLENDGIPLKYVYLPNFNAQPQHGNIVSPLYSSAPAPMGLGDFGISVNSTGAIVPYTYETPSFEAKVTINNLYDFYLLDDGPYSVTFQLNTVLNHVTLFGNSSYVFWNQNVVFYSARTHQLTFLDNIWNFSSSAFYMSTNSIVSGNGTLVPGVFYYAIGPTFTVSYPFTVYLYLNSTVINDDTAVFFNYTVVSNGTSISGSYDTVLFNSSYGMPTGYVTPQPYYLVSGSQITPNGYLLNDAEIMIGGPGGGSTTMIYNINATMNLLYYNSTLKSYRNVPAAFDFGTDTGETSEGIAEYWANETAYLQPGPSFLFGMWNASMNNAFMNFNGQVTPPNAFMFVSPGNSFNESLSAWSPLSLNGQYNFKLPYGNYSAKVMLSDYDPIITQLSSSNVFRLHKDLSMGIYTPLYAFNNNQLSYISFQGNGSESNPYVIFNNEYSPIDSIFAVFNDYTFPTFSGVLIMNTNAYVDLNNMPSFMVYYPSYYYVFLNSYLLPTYNYLNFEFYNTTHLSLYGTQYISGWFTAYLNGFPLANVILWNSTGDLIAKNTFYSMGSSLLIYNPNSTVSGNVIWGNYFLESNLEKTINTIFLADQPPMGISVYSSYNTIYNNYFCVQNPAISIPYDIYTGYPALYVDSWNISMEPLSYYVIFNGYNLTGSILGTGYQGGNYWFNFNGMIPFNDLGYIYYGGDYLPLNYTSYTVTFVPIGFQNLTWSVEIINPSTLLVLNFTTTANDTFYLLPGTYVVFILPPAGYTTPVNELVLTVTSNMVVPVNFYKLYSVTFVEKGLPQGTEWGVNVNGSIMESTGNISFSLTNGSYTYSVMPIPGYYAIPSSGTFTVNGANLTINIKFEQVKYSVIFNEVGLPAGTKWYVNLSNGQSFSSSTSTIVFNEPNGTYSYTIATVNEIYHTSSFSGTFGINGNSYSETVTFTEMVYPVTFNEMGLATNYAWTVEINNVEYSTGQNSLTVNLPNGTYSYIVYSSGYSPSPSSGTFTVNGSSTVINIKFTEVYYTITFIESGLASGTTWSVTINGNMLSSTSNTITFSEPNGTYQFIVGNVAGYSLTPSSGVVTVNGASQTVNVTYKAILYTVTFQEYGLPSGANWSVTINGKTYYSTSNVITVTLPYGNYSYSISLPSGYKAPIQNGTISSSQLMVSPVLAVSSTYTGISPLDIVLIVIIIILVVIAIVEVFYYRKKIPKSEPPKEWKPENKQ